MRGGFGEKRCVHGLVKHRWEQKLEERQACAVWGIIGGAEGWSVRFACFAGVGQQVGSIGSRFGEAPSGGEDWRS